MRLIDADKLIEDVRKNSESYFADDFAKEWVDKQPTVAQPEIIRCRDCKHYKRYEYIGDFACHYVIGGTVRREPDDFCSRAERREVSE